MKLLKFGLKPRLFSKVEHTHTVFRWYTLCLNVDIVFWVLLVRRPTVRQINFSIATQTQKQLKSEHFSLLSVSLPYWVQMKFGAIRLTLAREFLEWQKKNDFKPFELRRWKCPSIQQFNEWINVWMNDKITWDLGSKIGQHSNRIALFLNRFSRNVWN